MKSKRSHLARIYKEALRRYMKSGSHAGLRSALKLGRQAVSYGMETLDLAMIHEQALIEQVLPVGAVAERLAIIKRAKLFFSEAVIPMEETHRSAMEAHSQLRELYASLSRRTTDLASSNRQLKKEIIRRLAAEGSLRKSEQQARILLEQARLQQEEMRLLSHRILLVQEEERKRISRELHDVIAQMLTGINLRLATLKVAAAADSKGLSGKISRTQRLVEKSVNIVHRFARELRPAVLDDLGLIPALQSFLKIFSREAGIRVKLTAFEGVEELSIAKRTALYRVAHEALTNVARHAKAGRAEVNIQKHSNAIGMDISDNGRGFELTHVLHNNKCKRLGLLGIRERVEMVGGKFSVESAPNRGTTIHAMIPCGIGAKEAVSL